MSKPHTGPALPADRLHLLPRHREMLLALLREHLPGIEVWAYGSRVNGQSHDGSDLDLVLRSPDLQEIPIGRVGDFWEALRESNIPFLVEARDWARLPEGFHREIEREYVVLVEKEEWGAASEWPTIRFTDAVQINPPVRLERGKAYPFVDMAIVNADLRCAYAVERRVYSGGGTRFRSGDTLMARITPCLENGKIARYCAPDPTEFAHGSTEFIIIRGRPNVTDHEFVYYLTQWGEVRHYAIGQMTGTSGRQRVPTKSLDHLAVTIPPLSEQRAIAHILGTLDDKIELNRRMNETLESMSRALFKSWFVDFDPVHAKAALKHHVANRIPRQGDSTRSTKAAPSDHSPLEGESTRQGRQPAVEPVGGNQTPLPLLKGSDWTAERAQAYLAGMEPEITALFPDSFAASELGPIPAGWEVKPLGALVELAYGKGLKADQRQTGSVPVYGSNGRVGWHDQPFIQGPNIIVGRKGNPGTVTYAAGACFPIDTTFYVVPKDTPQSLPFLFYALEGQGLSSVAADSAVPGLNRNLAYLNKQVTPPTPLVARFGEHVQSLFTRRHGLEEESRTLASLRDTLLPKLVSGELRIDAPQGFSTEFHDG